MAAPNEFLTGVIGKVTFVNRWPLLLKATQDDATPTAGYLFKEIADITYESGNNCQCLVDFLVERLEKKSCHIKYKVLKIMLHMVEKGHPSFCEALRRKAQGIQAASKCSGPPNLLHGMAPYVAVRKAAKALSERLFDTETASGVPLTNQTMRQNHMTHAAMKSREGVSVKMEGFGNTPDTPQKPVSIESLGETMKGGLQQIANKLSGENKSAMTFTQADTGYKPLHGYDPSSIHSPGRQGLLPSRSSNWFSHHSNAPSDYSPVVMKDDDDEMRREQSSISTKVSSSSSSKWLPHHSNAPSDYSPVMMTDDDNEMRREHIRESTGDLSASSSRCLPHQKIDDVRWSAPVEDTSLIDTSSLSRGGQSNGSKSSDQLSGAGSDLSERLASVSVADWSEEVSTVEAFISNHHEGRLTPVKEELQKFVKRSSSLNCEKMLELLTSHLVSSHSAQLHCLFGIEGILKADLMSSDVALNLLTPHLTSVQASKDKAVRAKALKILRQLERLEADTRLDKPLMPESQLLSQNALDVRGSEVLVSSAQSTPAKHALTGPASESQILSQFMIDSTDVSGSSASSTPVTQAASGSVSERQLRSQSILDTTKPEVNLAMCTPVRLTALGSLESQLLSKSIRDTAEAEESSAHSTPVKHAPPASSSVGVAQESGGPLFSGMNVTGASASPPRENRPKGTSLRSDNSANRTSERYQAEDLLMDVELVPSSKSSDRNLLLSDNPQSSVVNCETVFERTGYGNYLALAKPASVTPESKVPVEQEATHKKSIDPIMSREASFADLWNTVSPKDASSRHKASNQNLSQLSTPSPQVNMSSNPHPNAAFNQPVLTAQHIGSMYPQLSSAKLSGTTSTPINLSKKPVTGFGFVVDGTDDSEKTGASSRDAFSFIQDAMKSSKS